VPPTLRANGQGYVRIRIQVPEGGYGTHGPDGVPVQDRQSQLPQRFLRLASGSWTQSQYKGTGTINGSGNYGFMLTATDGQVPGGGGTDTFRIKIWIKATDAVVYDSGVDSPLAEAAS